MIEFSIIIPVYNLEECLESCLDSVTKQSYKNYEVILIDDGSKDSSARICDSYANVDARFKVYHLENSGVSSARNKGIELAMGKWIVFVDGDDLLCDDALEKLQSEIKREDADAIFFAAEAFYKGHKQNIYVFPLLADYGTINSKRYLYESIQLYEWRPMAPWCGVIKRDVLIKNSICKMLSV